ncbi:MAG: 8-oxo-dGTP pyrophosphatase MutT (NUDIX family) [Candidatus Paceibacteria bacterium]|jgi:8-oxo-dGTP pyrophosphatase MutT (NUDIX family)
MIQKLKKKLCKRFCKKKPLRDIVLIFPYDTQENKMLVIEEFIHHYDRSFWKFISGGIDKQDKDNLTHAHEELAEEMGMQSENLYHFHSTEKIFGMRGIHCFVAENPKLMEHPPENPDTDIITDRKWLSQNEFQGMLDSKELIWNEGAMTALQIFRKYSNQ